MITSLSQLDPNRRYTYADYLTWQLDEYVELIRGKIYAMSPAPLRRHQDISGNLFWQIGYHLKNSPCKVYSAPFDVRFVKKHPVSDQEITTVVQPDVCVVCDQDKLDEKGCLGAPDLVIEIVSPSSAKKDLNEKYSLYEEFGVKEYWVVWPEDRAINVYLHDGSQFTLLDTFDFIYKKGGKIPVGIFPGLELDMEIIFRD